MNQSIRTVSFIILMFIISFIILVISFLFYLSTQDPIEMGFGPEYETVVINQNIGGELICNSVYTADLQSYYFDIKYTYCFAGDTINIGSGYYYGKEWKKEEQLHKYGNYLLLKTSANRFYDNLLIANNNINEHINITPKLLNYQDEIKLNSYENNDYEMRISKIKQDTVKVIYKHNKGKRDNYEYDKLTFVLDTLHNFKLKLINYSKIL